MLKLASQSQALQCHFEGWIEEVDTGRELRFRSTEELLAFLGLCFDLAQRRQREAEKTSGEGT